MIELCDDVSFWFAKAAIGQAKGVPLNVVGVGWIPIVFVTEVLVVFRLCCCLL